MAEEKIWGNIENIGPLSWYTCNIMQKTVGRERSIIGRRVKSPLSWRPPGLSAGHALSVRRPQCEWTPQGILPHLCERPVLYQARKGCAVNGGYIHGEMNTLKVVVTIKSAKSGTESPYIQCKLTIEGHSHIWKIAGSVLFVLVIPDYP